MVKTQIQLPDHLYRESKRASEEYEISLAEICRRSLERALPSYPPRKPTNWTPPEPRHLGQRCLIDDDEWRLLPNDPDYVPRHLNPVNKRP